MAEDYVLGTDWSTIDAVAAAYGAGHILLIENQATKNSNMTARVGVDNDGRLWVAPSTGGGDETPGGGGYSPPDGGIPMEDLSQDVQDLLTGVQLARHFVSMDAYNDFASLPNNDRKRGDVIIINSDDDESIVIYQLGKDSTDPLALMEVITIQKPQAIPGPEGPQGPPGGKGEPGADGHRGTGFLTITTEPTSYATVVNGINVANRISLSTVKSQAGVSEVFEGDTLRHNYYLYPVLYVDEVYVYCGASMNIRGSDGEDSVIWYTNVAPTSGYFAISNLSGPSGAIPSPGHMIVSSYTGMGYFITASDGSAVTVSSDTVRVTGPKGADGYTPQKGVDYWTGADQESIVQQVITALGTPVFGRVDESNNIILTGGLVDGTYTLSYEDAAGNRTKIGTITIGATSGRPIGVNMVPLSINADGTPFIGDNGEVGYRTGYRLNSAGSTTGADGFSHTGFMPVEKGDTISFAGMTFSANTVSPHQQYIQFYDENFALLSYVSASEILASAGMDAKEGVVEGAVFAYGTTDYNPDTPINYLTRLTILQEGAKYMRVGCHGISAGTDIRVMG